MIAFITERHSPQLKFDAIALSLRSCEVHPEPKLSAGPLVD